MRNEILLIAIVLVAGCTILPNDSILSTLNINLITQATEEMSVDVEIPSFVREGKTFQWTLTFAAENDITNLLIDVYDKGPYFSEDVPKVWEANEVFANRSKLFKTTYNVAEIDFPTEKTKIKFLIQYDSKFSATKTISMLDDFEYESRYSKGTLSDMVTEGISSDVPLNIKISFDKPEPFQEDDEILMYLDYSFTGDGLISELSAESVKITFPKTILELVECDDFTYVDKTPEESSISGAELPDDEEPLKGYVLLYPLTFFEGKARRSTCKFKTISDQPIATGSFQVTADYTYQLLEEISMEIRE
jgi:hypothetical protein